MKLLILILFPAVLHAECVDIACYYDQVVQCREDRDVAYERMRKAQGDRDAVIVEYKNLLRYTEALYSSLDETLVIITKQRRRIRRLKRGSYDRR